MVGTRFFVVQKTPACRRLSGTTKAFLRDRIDLVPFAFRSGGF